jgi:sugar/nucleoside kinase (ribokinase family)
MIAPHPREIAGMRVLGLGHCPLDETYRTDRVVTSPAALSELGPPAVRAGGGAVGNTLCLLAALGHECHMVANAGDDDRADFLAAEFRGFGVTPHLVRKPGRATPRFAMLVDPAGRRRSVLDWNNAPSDITAEDAAGAVPAGLGTFDLLVTEMRKSAAAELMSRTRRTVYNGQSHRVGDRKRAALGEMLARCSLAVLCEEFLRSYWELPPHRPLDRGHLELPAPVVIATLGGSGLVARSGEAFFRQPIPAPVTVADTTGAGDAFLGALLHRLGPDLPGDPQRLESACSAAQRVAGICCSHLGARGYLSAPTAVRAAAE